MHLSINNKVLKSSFVLSAMANFNSVINMKEIFTFLKENRQNISITDKNQIIMVSETTFSSLTTSANNRSISIGILILMTIICSVLLCFTLSCTVSVLCCVRKRKIAVEQLNRCELDSLYSASLNTLDVEDSENQCNFSKPEKILPKSWSYISNLTTSTSIYTNLSCLDNEPNHEDSVQIQQMFQKSDAKQPKPKRKVWFLTPSHRAQLEMIQNNKNNNDNKNNFDCSKI